MYFFNAQLKYDISFNSIQVDQSLNLWEYNMAQLQIEVAQ